MVTTCDEEREHLAQSEQHIEEGERVIAAQEARIAQMLTAGRDVTVLQDVPGTMQVTLKAHRAHRMLILDTIARRAEAEFGDVRIDRTLPPCVGARPQHMCRTEGDPSGPHIAWRY